VKDIAMAYKNLGTLAVATSHGNRWWDHVVLRVLSSPLHPVASGSLAVLQLRGRKTGRRITLPVQYAWNRSMIVVVPGRPETKRWWRNLADERPVRLLVRGIWLDGTGKVLTVGDEEYTSARSAYAQRWHSNALPAGAPVVRVSNLEEKETTMTTTAAPDPTRVLTEDQCWEALSTTDVGRLAVRAGEDIDVFPVNFLVTDREVYFRTAPGSKMIELTAAPRVAFEADGTTSGMRWSVTLRGDAHRLGFDSEIEASGVRALRSSDPTVKWNYVRITPRSISGRRFVPSN
jgi:nitroimidazol reductase NimA-like FMN-containing flavoprotein (pyridoxamine 5'-phosphate oxidase superfamily)